MYKEDCLRGGHIILLNSRQSEYYEQTKQQAKEALRVYPKGLQIGEGITMTRMHRIYRMRSEPCDRHIVCVSAEENFAEKI